MEEAKRDVKGDVKEMIGRTPLLHLKSISEKCGSQILLKCENMNPGGSFVDRLWLENQERHKYNQNDQTLDRALDNLAIEIQSQHINTINGFVGIGGLNFLEK